jgi:hypothetical protein
MLNEDEDLGFSASTQLGLKEIASRLKGIGPVEQAISYRPRERHFGGTEWLQPGPLSGNRQGVTSKYVCQQFVHRRWPPSSFAPSFLENQ